MKPFDLEELKAGKTVVTRRGWVVRIFATNLNSNYPIVGAVFNPELEFEIVMQWNENGRYVDNNTESCDDLMLDYDEPVVRWYRP